MEDTLSVCPLIVLSLLDFSASQRVTTPLEVPTANTLLLPPSLWPVPLTNLTEQT